jgi:TonB family protein
MRKIVAGRMLTGLKNRLKNLDQAELGRKALSLSIAIILHLVLILYLRQAKIYVKILPFQKPTEVLIAQYPALRLPENLEEVIKHPPAAEDLTARRKAGEEKGGVRPGGQIAAPGQPGQLPGAGPKSRKERPAGEEQPIIPFDLEAFLASGGKEISPPGGVRLDLTFRFKSRGKHDFSLKLPVRPEPSPEAGKEEATPGLKSDIYKYLEPKAYQQARKSLRFSPGGKIRPGGTGIPGSGEVAFSGYHYDINPWAEKVVNLIQSRWALPQVAVMPDNKNLGLVLLVDRDGQLVSLEITNSTTSEVLDQAAISAVRLCLPFPPLPPDFPGKKLEFYLVFTYHD